MFINRETWAKIMWKIFSKVLYSEIIKVRMRAQSCPTESCLTHCNPMDCSLPGSSVRGILQARILEWVAISYSRGSSLSRDWSHISCVLCIGRWILHHWAPWEARNACVVLRHWVLADSVTPWTVVHQAPLFLGVLQVRLLERGAMPSSRGSSQPRDGTQISRSVGRFFTVWAAREARECWSGKPIPSPGDLPEPGIEPGSPEL